VIAFRELLEKTQHLETSKGNYNSWLGFLPPFDVFLGRRSEEYVR
jgi:hypothetical protein